MHPRDRLERARLYLVTDAGMPEAALGAALAHGVDMVQLRDRALGDDDLVAAAARMRALCEAHDALFWVNDRPDLAVAAGAHGVHLGQHDMPTGRARGIVGPDVLIGLSTHSREQLAAAIASEADQLSVGPVWETPTKPGRPATGLELIRHAAAVAPPQPWFAIGGIDAANVGEVVGAGAARVVVVRAVRDAADPAGAAAALRAALGQEGRVGAAQ